MDGPLLWRSLVGMVYSRTFDTDVTRVCGKALEEAHVQSRQLWE
jgi:hypothetical protein